MKILEGTFRTNLFDEKIQTKSNNAVNIKIIQRKKHKGPPLHTQGATQKSEEKIF